MEFVSKKEFEDLNTRVQKLES